jgi:hypothetical protein
LHKHILAKQKQLGINLTKLYWLLGHKCWPSMSNKLLLYKVILKPTWTYGIQLLPPILKSLNASNPKLYAW